MISSHNRCLLQKPPAFGIARLPFNRCKQQPLVREHCRTSYKCRSTSDDLQLVKREEKDDGTLLFVFGTSEEAQAENSESEEEKPGLAVQAAEDHPTVSTPEAPESAHKDNEQDEGIAVELAAENETDDSQSPETQESIGSHKTSELEALDAPALQSLKVTELKELCKKHNVKGYYKMKKDELVDALASV